MSKDDININISGGSAKFGNLSQGNNNKLDLVIHSEYENIDEFHAAIESAREANKITHVELEKLKNEVHAALENSNDNDISVIVKKLYEKYEWALAPLKKLFTLILP